MARQQGTYKLASNIEPRAAAPLDAREKVALKNDLTATGTFPYPYEGMEVYVVEEKKKYVLIGADPTVSENWQEVGSGGGDVIEYVETLPTGNDIQNKIYNAKTEGEITLPIIESLNHDEVIKYYEGFLTSEETGDTVPTTIFYPKEGISISRFIKIKYVWYSDFVNYVSIEGILPEGTGYHIDSYSKTDTDYPRYSEKELTFEYVTNDKYYAGDNTNQTLTKLAKQENASNIFTGTHSEWDAMSIIKKQEYDYAAFTDDENGIFEYYSTTETKTNKVWIDGKPIYRKVYPVTITEPTSSAKIVITLDNSINKDNAKIIAHGGYLEPGTSGDNYIKGIPYIYKDNDTVASITCAISSSGILMIYSNINPGNTGYVWVEYTKTTD